MMVMYGMGPAKQSGGRRRPAGCERSTPAQFPFPLFSLGRRKRERWRRGNNDSFAGGGEVCFVHVQPVWPE